MGPDGVTISMTSESGVSVMFVPLHTSHGGEYRGGGGGEQKGSLDETLADSILMGC